MYKFTQDWFDRSIPLFTSIAEVLPYKGTLLEIGAFEGRSTVWLAEHMLDTGGTLHSVDHWEGGEEHAPLGIDVAAAETLWDANIASFREAHPDKEIFKWKMPSQEALTKFASMGFEFDFIYIDGGHTAAQVMSDAVAALPLLKQGGYMVFDDYLWGEAGNLLHRPKMAIDAFSNIYAEQLDIAHIGQQYALRKR